MESERLFNFIGNELKNEKTILEEKLELVINSDLSIIEKSKKINKILKKLSLLELTTSKFISMTTN